MNRAEAQAASLNGSVRKRTAAPSPSSERKHKSMEEIMRAAKPASPITEDYYSDVLCQQCRLGEDEDKIILCDRCDLGFHLYCLRPIVPRVPTGPWFCPSCKDEKTVRRFPLMQKSIVNFFRIRKCTNELPKEICGPWNGGRKRRRRSIFLCSHKKRRRLVPFSPSKDPNQRLLQMGSLATALTSLKMEFSNDLTYFAGMAPRSANTAFLEKGGMQVLAREDKETLELCKTMYSRGECPPLVVIFDPCEGFTVHADDDIKDMTFISEYTGDVDYLKKREHDDCDSMMTLLLATNPCNSLVVCPDKRGNIARFVSGINNHTLLDFIIIVAFAVQLSQPLFPPSHLLIVGFSVQSISHPLFLPCRSLGSTVGTSLSHINLRPSTTLHSPAAANQLSSLLSNSKGGHEEAEH